MQPPSFSLLLAAALSTISRQGQGSFATVRDRRSAQPEPPPTINTWLADFEFHNFFQPEPIPPMMPELFNPLGTAKPAPSIRIWRRTSRDFDFYNSLDPEVAPSVRSDFDKRSAEPEPEAEVSAAGFEDFKYNFRGPAKIGFPDSYNNALRQLSASELKAEEEAGADFSKILNELSQHHILAKRSAEPEPEAEAEPIGNSLYKFNNYYYPGRGWPDDIRFALFNFKQRRSTEPELFGKSIKDLNYNSLLARGLSLMSMM